MIDFKQAIDIATSNAKSLLSNANNFQLEGVLISDNDKFYEVTLSYGIEGPDPLSTSERKKESGLYHLARIMGYRREYKTFLVDKTTGKFKGFKNYKDR